MEWIIDNKEWVFSGIGAVILGAIITYLTRKKEKPNQQQKGGKNSTNIQAGRDVNYK